MLKYRSGSTGEEIELSSGNIRAHIKTAGLHDYEWEVNATTKLLGSKIKNFGKKAKKYEITLDFRGNQEERANAAEKFYELSERDVVKMMPGRLIFKDHYLMCYIIGGEIGTSKLKRAVEKTVYAYAPYPFWIREESRSFPPISPNEQQDDACLDYEHDYQYDYTMPHGGDVIWKVDHFAPCEFLMTMFGPAVDPRVVINGHPYQIYTTLDTNEYLQIDSRNNRVIKYLANGIQQDIYDLRAKQESVFDPITPGNISVVWPGDFGFDLTLFCERSEPRWKTRSS